jgi:hypothetical protein
VVRQLQERLVRGDRLDPAEAAATLAELQQRVRRLRRLGFPVAAVSADVRRLCASGTVRRAG